MDKIAVLSQEEFFNGIDDRIEANGVVVAAYIKPYIIPETELLADLTNVVCTLTEDVYIYTVGHKSRDRPDLLVFLGPSFEGGELVGSILEELITNANMMVGHLVNNWEDTPLNKGDIVTDPSGRSYRAYPVEGIDSIIKDDITHLTTQFYESHDYELLILRPIPPCDIPNWFKNRVDSTQPTITSTKENT